MFAILRIIRIGPGIEVDQPLFECAIDENRELPGGRGDRLRFADPKGQTSVERGAGCLRAARVHANNETLAVSSTGLGEHVMRVVAAKEMSDLMALAGLSVSEATERVRRTIEYRQVFGWRAHSPVKLSARRRQCDL